MWTKVNPFDGNEDLFGRLASAVGTPEANKLRVVEKEVPKTLEKEQESEKDEYEGESKTGDELDDAGEFLMELKSGKQLSFEDIVLLMDYVDARLAKMISRQDLASRLRSSS